MTGRARRYVRRAWLRDRWGLEFLSAFTAGLVLLVATFSGSDMSERAALRPLTALVGEASVLTFVALVGITQFAAVVSDRAAPRRYAAHLAMWFYVFFGLTILSSPGPTPLSVALATGAATANFVSIFKLPLDVPVG